MIYRPFQPGDFEALYAVEEICFEPSLRFSRGFLRRVTKSARAATWVAEESGAMAAFAILEWSEEAGGIAAYIQTIEVLPAMRRRGVGAELMRRLEQSARDAGAKAIWLHVDAENAGAIRLYEAHGYQHRGTKANYYPRGRAALIYAKALEGTSEGA